MVSLRRKRVIVHCGLPAAGKSSAAQRSVSGRSDYLLIDKDRVNPYEKAMIEVAGGPGYDQDPAEMDKMHPITMSMLGLCVQGALFSGAEVVVVDAPLIGESVLAKARGQELSRFLEYQWSLWPRSVWTIWHEISPEDQYERMLTRGTDRDRAKLADWAGYQAGLARQRVDLPELEGLVDALVVTP